MNSVNYDKKNILIPTIIMVCTFFLVAPYFTNASVVNRSATNAVQNGLSAYWTFDGKNTVGGAVQDSSGNGSTGTLLNIATTTFFTQGEFGQAARFDGVDDEMNINISASSVFSISMWLMPINQTAAHGALLTEDTTKGLTLKSNNSLSYVESGDHSTGTVLSNNTWQHIVLVSNGTTLTFYINGVQDSSPITFTPTSINFTTLGNDSGSELYSGKMDDVRVYNRVISAIEVQQLYNESKSKMDITNRTGIRNGLVGEWTFDGKDTAKGNFVDGSGNGSTGYGFFVSTSTFYIRGLTGQSISVNGTSYIDVGNPAAIQLGNRGSVSAWVKYGVQASYEGIACKDDLTSDVNGYCLFTDSAGHIGFEIATAISHQEVDGLVVHNDNLWHLFTATWDGTTINLYVDAKFDTSGSQLSITPTNTNNLNIGKTAEGTSHQLVGSIDDVRLYNRALSAAEILELYGQMFGKINISSPNAVRTGLVGYWTFDGKDMPKGVLDNVVNNAENGNPRNIASTTFYAMGKIGQAGKFDGSNDDAILPNSSTYNFDNTNNFTVAAWINLSTTGATEPIFNTVNVAGTGGYSTYISSGNVVGFTVYSGGGSSAITGNTTVTPNTWHHVAYVFTGPTTANLYLDGALDKTGAFTQNLATISANRFIGQNQNLASFFNGKIDDVRVYNRSLTAIEIQQLYSLGK